MRRAGRVGLVTAVLVAAGLAVVPTAGADPVATSSSTSPAAASPAAAERVCPPATATTVTCYAERRTDVVTPHAAGAAPSGYGPADLRRAYSIPTTGGSGVTVAAVVAHDHPTALNDLAVYRSTFGLPALATGQFRKVNQNGATGPLPSYDAGWAGEAATDVQLLTATCPSCRILLVEANTPNLTDVAAAARTAVKLGATYVSNSFGANERNTTSLAASWTAPGVSWFASTGDDGWSAGAPSFPATVPGVTAVGGTTLRKTSTARGFTETAWAGSGDGNACSTTYAQPTRQAGLSTGCAGRAVADVAAIADPSTGVAVYNSSGGGTWGVWGGTSAATPVVTGIAALAGVPGLSGDDLYNNAAEFNDVTAGSTGSCGGSPLCTARAGWDGPTGLGTPAGTGGFGRPDLDCGGTPATIGGSTTGTGRFVPVTPVRVLDTRLDGSTLGPSSGRTLDLGRYLPTGSATAVVVNLTVAGSTDAGYVTAWPAGSTQPFTSNLNFGPGQVRANEVTVALGPAGTGSSAATALALFNSAGRTDLVVDLLGWYTDSAAAVPALTYHPAPTPTRVVDTRITGGPLGNEGARSRVCATASLGDGAGGLVTGIGAVAVTITAVSPDGPGYLKAWAGGAADEPLVSTLNFGPGQTVPNAAVVPVRCLDTACSTVTFAVANRTSPATHVLVDVVGVYAADPDGGLVLRPQVPRRVVDTRTGLGFAPLGPGATGRVAVPGASGAGAVVANVTAVAPTVPTYLTVFGSVQPSTSNLNPMPGEVVPAEAVSGLGSGGVLRVFNSDGRVDVVVDVAGVFVAPSG